MAVTDVQLGATPAPVRSTLSLVRVSGELFQNSGHNRQKPLQKFVRFVDCQSVQNR
jgi:hypothetical protein